MSSYKLCGLSVCLSFMSSSALAYGLPSLDLVSYEVGGHFSNDSADLSVHQRANISTQPLQVNTDLTLHSAHQYKPGMFAAVNYELPQQWAVSAKLAGHFNDSTLYHLHTVDAGNEYIVDDRMTGGAIYTLGLAFRKKLGEVTTVALGPTFGYREYEIERTSYDEDGAKVGPNETGGYKLGIGLEAAIKYNIKQNWFISLSYSHLKFDKIRGTFPTARGSSATGTGYIDMEPDVDLLTIGFGVEFG